MSVYSNKQIKQAVKTGQIVFHPYQEKHIAGSSVDVTLGNWYYRTERPSEGGFYNPFDSRAVDGYFSGALKAERHSVWAKKHGRVLFENIPKDHPIIVLRPHERILAHTHEFIGIKAPGTSTMQARSTWSRAATTGRGARNRSRCPTAWGWWRCAWTAPPSSRCSARAGSCGWAHRRSRRRKPTA